MREPLLQRGSGMFWRQCGKLIACAAGAVLLGGAIAGASPWFAASAHTNAAGLRALHALVDPDSVPDDLEVASQDVWLLSAVRLTGKANPGAAERAALLRLLDAAAARQPDHRMVRFWLAQARASVGQPAADDYRAADALPYLLRTAVETWGAGDCAGSVRAAQLAGEAFPSSEHAAYLAAQGLECLGQTSEAVAAYRRATRLAGPTSWLGQVASGDVARLEQQVDVATEAYRQAIALAPSGTPKWLNGVLPYARLAAALRAAGAYDEAEAVLSGAALAFPHDEWLQLELQRVRSTRGAQSQLQSGR